MSTFSFVLRYMSIFAFNAEAEVTTTTLPCLIVLISSTIHLIIMRDTLVKRFVIGTFVSLYALVYVIIIVMVILKLK